MSVVAVSLKKKKRHGQRHRTGRVAQVKRCMVFLRCSSHSRTRPPSRQDSLRYQFFFSSRRRHTRSLRAWSSDVCSSDLAAPPELEDVAPLDQPILEEFRVGTL